MCLDYTSDVLLQVALLQRYNISLSDSTLKQLEEAPVAWAALQKKIAMKQVTAPLILLLCCGCALPGRQRMVSMMLVKLGQFTAYVHATMFLMYRMLL